MGYTTKKPTELKIDLTSTISGVAQKMTFKATWRIGDEDYNAGQHAWWRVCKDTPVNPSAAGGKTWENYTKHPVTVGKTAQESVFYEPGFSEYYPNNSTHLYWVRFSVKGQRGKFTKRKNGKDVKYDPEWSGTTARNLQILPPPVPVISQATDGSSEFSKNFGWSISAAASWVGNIGTTDESFQVYYDAVWESILVDNLTETYSAASWSSSHAGYQSGTITPGVTSDTITIIETNPSWTGNYSYTRYVRMYSRGPAGNSAFSKEASYTYSNNPTPSAPTSSLNNGTATVSSPSATNGVYNFDYYSIQHCISVPIATVEEHSDTDIPAKTIGTVTISPPIEGDSSWVEDIKTSTEGSYSFPIDSYAVEDKLIWSRTVGYKNNNQSKGVASLLSSYPGRLKPPSGLTISSINPSTHRVTVDATNNSEVPGSYLLIYFRLSSTPNSYRAYGLIPHNETNPITVQLPDWGENQFDIGVQAVLGNYSIDAPDAETGCRLVWVTATYLMSDIVWDGGQIPIPPTDVKLTPQKSGTIAVEWSWTWRDADVAEISWADHEDAWMSTSEPQTYVINNNYNGQWNISGLSVGKWYVRVRLGKRNGDAITYSMYSAIKETTITSAPTVPALTITPSVITPDGKVTLTWVYSSEDGSGQKSAQIFRANDLENVIKKVESDTSVVLTRNDIHWSDNERVELVINVLSTNDELSQGYSKSAAFQVAPLPSKPVISFSSGWDANTESVIFLPLRFSVSGINSVDKLTIVIERASGDIVHTPYEDNYPVYAGEISYLDSTRYGNASVIIDRESLLKDLDDRARYILRVTNKDAYGQTNKTEVEFTVNWTHKATKPEATIAIDRERYIAKISPIRPSGNKYTTGDTCDIYRLSADKPQLVMRGAELTNPPTTYVDLYPTIGEFGGYRIIYRTVNGDYRMNIGYAMTNYDGDECSINEFVSIISFDGDEVRLRYNLSLSNSWNKDFTETKYLGGAVQGDWNPAVSRSGSLKATVSIQEDPMSDEPQETIEGLRRLAIYSGVCFVRTPDGSSYYANVDVQEDREEKWVSRIGKFSLNITRVDPPTSFEPLTYEEYITDEEED